MYRPSGIVNRIPELLDQLKSEYDCLSQEVSMYKNQREEFERKLQSQLSELSSIQKTLFELEKKQSKVQQHYEEEIYRFQSGGGRHDLPPSQPFPNPSIAAQPPGDSRIPDKQPQMPLTNLQHPSRQQPQQQQQQQQPNFGPLSHSMPPPQQGAGSSSSSSAGLQGQIPQQSQFSPIGSKRPRPEDPAHFNSLPSIPSINTDAGPPPKQLNILNEKHDFPSSSGIPMTSPLAPPPVPSGGRDIDEKPPRHGPQMHMAPPQPQPQPQLNSSSSAPPNASNGSETEDWRVGYNSSVQTNLGVDLAFDFEHQSVVCCVKFSNDGKWLATGCNKTAQVYSVSTGERVHVFTDETKSGDSYLRSVCFSPDGKYLACGAEDKTIKLWDIERNHIATTLQGHTMDIYSLDFSNDGRFIVSGSGDKKARIWSVEKRSCLHILGNDEVGPKDGVTSVAISPDGRYVAAGSLDRIVRLWDATTGYFLERYEGHTDSVYSVAFSPDGKSLASGSLDKTLRLWDLNGNRARSRCRTTFAGHSDFVLSVAFSPDGNWLISGSKDRSVQFWDPRSAVTHMKLEGHKNSVISVAVSPTGGYFATGSGDCKARVWKYKPCTPGTL